MPSTDTQQFADYMHARGRLQGTINEVNDELLYFDYVESNMSASAYPVGKGLNVTARKTVRLNNDIVKAPKISFGWLNTKSNTAGAYASRSANRGQGTQMGVVPRNVSMFRPSSDFSLSDAIGSLGSFLEDEVLFESLLGKYPNLDEALGKNTMVALSKDFAIRPATLSVWNLFHRTDVVGEVDTRQEKVSLYSGYSYLKERLEKLLKGAGAENYELE